MQICEGITFFLGKYFSQLLTLTETKLPRYLPHDFISFFYFFNFN